MKIDIICPLYNASKYILNLHKSLLMQENVNINKIKYILTRSSDDSLEILKSNNLNYKLIEKNEFSHSLTREEAALESDADIIVFISQDIIINKKDWLYELVKPLICGEAEASYSRQITKYNNIEKYTRECNYPEVSSIKTRDDIDKLGLRTFFFSDASSAILKKVFVEIDGYDHKKLPINEDMYIAYKIIMNGYRIKYCSNSIIVHSHKFTLKQLYNRYKLTGQFFKENSYLDKYKTNGTGFKLAKYALKRSIQDHNFKVTIRCFTDMFVRYLGMKAGKK